jgi:hypothetical protein
MEGMGGEIVKKYRLYEKDLNQVASTSGRPR